MRGGMTMKRRILVVLAAVVVLATMAALPAAADSHRDVPIRGTQDLDLNLGIVTGEGAAPTVSWVGTVDFRGTVYPIAYFPTAPLVQIGWWVLFEEQITIYASLDYEFTDGVLTTFEPGDVIFTATDAGFGTPRGSAEGFGEIIEANGDADPYGVLSEVQVGDWTHWVGRYANAEGTEFGGAFRIFPVG
jgi:hypothetical protein